MAIVSPMAANTAETMRWIWALVSGRSLRRGGMRVRGHHRCVSSGRPCGRGCSRCVAHLLQGALSAMAAQRGRSAALLSDGYEAYAAYGAQRPDEVDHALCWSHTRQTTRV